MGVRVDQALHWLCLIRSRSLAARACREGRVLVNGAPVRPSREVRAGDRIQLRDLLEERSRELELLEEPLRQISRRESAEYVRWCDGAGAAGGSRGAAGPGAAGGREVSEARRSAGGGEEPDEQG